MFDRILGKHLGSSTFRRLASLFIVFAVACTAEACTTTRCSFESHNGVSLRITDIQTGAPICDATVIVTGASPVSSETLWVIDCTYLGLRETPGRFTVSIRRDGYRETSREVRIERDDTACETLQTQHLDVALEPEHGMPADAGVAWNLGGAVLLASDDVITAAE